MFILGVSGWIGHYLAKSLTEVIPNCQISGSYNTNRPNLRFPLHQISNEQTGKLLEILEYERPDCVVNLARGEDEDGFRVHKALVEYSNTNSCLYAYSSSSNACDFDPSRSHLESEIARAKSDYGKFKARCESELLNRGRNFCIFRFSATHGWAPNRVSRTEEFLTRLKAGEDIIVKRGIIQNRAATPHLTNMMSVVISKQGQGVYHLGTTDCSEEIEFLTNMAIAFGYSPARITEGEEMVWNANMIPDKILHFSDVVRLNWKESDTITCVRQMPQLERYVRGCPVNLAQKILIFWQNPDFPCG